MNRYYATQPNPQGISDLIICDEDGQIIDVQQEALFGVPFNKFDEQFEQVIYCDGDYVFPVWSSHFIQAPDWENTVAWISEYDIGMYTNQLHRSIV